MNPFVSLSWAQLVSEAKARRKSKNLQEALSRRPELALQESAELRHLTQHPRYPLGDSLHIVEKIDSALGSARAYVLSQQAADGSWCEVLDTNTTLTSEFIMLGHFMGMRESELEQEACRYLLQQQQEEGGWPIYFGGPSEISTSIEAYFALKLCGHSPEAPYMRRARECILRQGGILKSRIFTRINLALFGQYPWSGIPLMPAQLMLLPKGFTFNIYEFASWARVVIVPLTIIMTYKPVVPIPSSAWVDELYLEPIGQRNYNFTPLTKGASIEALFIHLDKTMKILDRLPIKPFLKTSLRKAERWILAHQDDTGDWGGILPAKINSLMAFRCLGYPNHHPVIQKGWQAILRFQDRRAGVLHQQSCVSPVWDSAWYAFALMKSGLDPHHSSIEACCTWLLDKQILRGGDWKIKNPRGEPGGWAFEYYNDFYPDVDDTTAVLTTLLHAKFSDQDRAHTAFHRGFRWVLSMQNPDGGWAAFEREINHKILNEIPFADLKSLLDPSTCDLTGRVLELLGILGYDRNSRVVRRAIRFMRQNQHECGGWWGRWGVNYIYGTWGVLLGLKAVGEDMSQDYIQKAVRWLKEIQNPDGGWGESCKSYEDETWIGRGKSTPSQTAWALMSLMAAGEAKSLTIRRGIEFLLKNQNDDGSWFEEEYTGTGFPRHFYLGYRGYKNYFSMLALSQYKALIEHNDSPQA